VVLAAGGGETDLARQLKAAEEEASKLREQLAAAQGTGAATPVEEDLTQDQLAKKKVVYDKKIDGTSGRMGASSMGNVAGSDWLTESDLDFFTGGGIGEEGGGPSGNEDGTVTRRVLIGGGLSLAVIAAAFLPQGRPTPSQPLYFYLIPTLASINLLKEGSGYAATGDLDQLRGCVKAVLGRPNNLKENMLNAAALLESDADYKRGDALAREIAEFIQEADFKVYFDTQGMPSGSQALQYAEFSKQSIRAALGKLDEFLALCPREDVAQASSIVNPAPEPEPEAVVAAEE